MIPVVMLSGIIGLSACGNKTEQPQQNADTLEVADTIKEDTAAIDTPQTAEVQENAQEEKTVEKNVKSTRLVARPSLWVSPWPKRSAKPRE